MRFDLTLLFSGQTDSIPFETSIDLADTQFHAAYPFAAPIRVSGSAQHAAGEYSLHLDLSCELAVPCDRCAEITRPQFSFSLEHPLLPVSQQDSGEPDAVVVDENFSLDLGEVARADLLLELPSKFLCSPDCKGLCPQCGANLNFESCTCITQPMDPRLEILKTLIDS